MDDGSWSVGRLHAPATSFDPGDADAIPSGDHGDGAEDPSGVDGTDGGADPSDVDETDDDTDPSGDHGDGAEDPSGVDEADDDADPGGGNTGSGGVPADPRSGRSSLGGCQGESFISVLQSERLRPGTRRPKVERAAAGFIDRWYADLDPPDRGFGGDHSPAPLESGAAVRTTGGACVPLEPCASPSPDRRASSARHSPAT